MTALHTVPDADYLRTEDDLAALFEAELSRATLEEVRVAHLDSSYRLLGVVRWSSGSRFGADMPVRAIVEEAFRLRSRAIILAHNHPSGDPTPSRADHAGTRHLRDVLSAVEITLLDHVIFAGGNRYSFRAKGLL
ncbi:JAB domain-containing protein [Sphingomonas sp. ID0503]|uniref:JAB domain-containing protein n=1 Tax=Sphingomonas sp. ID0503 TaxID=3399691 RepID=UPI003AFA95B5